jgi:hypothetical protein
MAGTIGKCKFQTAYPVCGRLAINAITFSQIRNEYTLSLADSAPQLEVHDKLDIWDESMIATKVNVEVTTVTDDETFLLALSDSFEQAGGYITAHGAPAYWWNDDNGKGDYLVFSYFHDFRDYQERDLWNARITACPNCGFRSNGPAKRVNQARWGMPRSVKQIALVSPPSNNGWTCIPFDPCAPQVICISPNGEIFPNGKTYPFPGSVTLDTQYGSLWQELIVQCMPDIFYEPPAPECITCTDDTEDPAGDPQLDDCDMYEDVFGDCWEDLCYNPCAPELGEYRAYAMRPWVEARDGVPAAWIQGDTPPNLGTYNPHILTLEELDTKTEPSGFVVPPPEITGARYDFPSLWTFDTSAWLRWRAMADCVCGVNNFQSPGRFAEDYEPRLPGLRCS